MHAKFSWGSLVVFCALLAGTAGPGCGSSGDTGTGPGDDGGVGAGQDATTGGGFFGGDSGAGGGSKCVPLKCGQLVPPVACGDAGDGCGGTIHCGDCVAPQTCGGGSAPSQCGGTAGCVKKTCADYPAGTCGQQSDTCGGLTPDCATCTGQDTCGGDPTKPGVCGHTTNTGPDGGACVKKTCADYPAGTCGQQSDGCNGLTAYCNPCPTNQSCGGGGTPDKCGAPPAVDASSGCTAKTCADYPGKCGVQSNGCGGFTANCNPCPSNQTCGGGGTPDVCGSPSCVKKTCADFPNVCGTQSDGCGGVTAYCNPCTSPASCGGGGTPGQCGQPACVAKTCNDTCAAAGIPRAQCCGQFADGCGGLTANCGGCVLPQICGGGGVGSQCGDSNLDSGGPACTGLCGQIPACDGGTNTTTITGRVYAGTDPKAGFGAPDPIRHAHVFIPNDPSSLTQFGTAVACACDTASGPAIASTYSDIDGSFTLTNVPAGTNIPVVIQLGRWRRVFYTTVTACAAGPAPGTVGTNGITDDAACKAGGTCNTRMPRVQNEFNSFDNIPIIAEVTGSADAMECILPKIGIDGAGVKAWKAGGAASTQYSNPGGGGRVIFYQANGTQIDNNTPADSTLWSTTAALDAYDMVVFDCEGGENVKSATALSNVQTYANNGGRVFATHYGYVWTFTNDPWGCGGEANTGNTTPQTATCTTSQHTVADWYADQSQPNGGAQVTAKIDDATMNKWLSQPLVNVATNGTVPLNAPRADTTGVIAPPSQLFLEIDGSNGSQPLEFTWNTPPFAQTQCGRVLFSDFHVYGKAGGTFPGECALGPLTAQEKVLEYEIFDLGDCVTSITPPPPPTCTKKTCANFPGVCGPQPDGCGGLTAYCNPCTSPQTCGGGGTPGVCGGGTCVKKTCASYPGTCGQQSDGCGGLTPSCGTTCSSCTALTCAAYPGTCGPQANGCGGLTTSCGSCPTGQACGGGGTPNVCGAPDAGACVPACPTGIKCGQAGDGCGGIIDCGSCPTGQTCGGGGTPGVCGTPPPCQAKTCASFPAGTCGQQSDGCGGLTANCGTCTSPQTCGGGGTAGVCGQPSCTPSTCAQTCAAAGVSSGCCGQFANGCGGLTPDCGACTAPQTCGGAGVANQCGGGIK